MSSLVHIADRALNRPLLLTRDKAQVILSVLAGRIGVNAPEASRFEGSAIIEDDNGRARGARPYNVKNGVAIITITGSLVNRGAWVGASSGLTSYEGIGHQLKTAKADDGVHSVILDIQSPGGEAVGAFETADLVRDLASKKKTVAVVNGMACSAAYAIASAATEIVTTQTGVSGSIGVVLLHADFSRQLDREGVTPTLIHAGAHKVDGNPFEPLSDAVREDLQAEVNAFYEAFVAGVAKGRGKRLTAAAARKTEARSFIGQAAVDAGLADRVGSFESVLSELSRASNGRSTTQPKGQKMSDLTGAPDAENAGITPEAHSAAVAAARTEGETAGAAKANARIAAIVSAEGIAGNAARMSAALDLAATAPGMSAEDVTKFVFAHTPEKAGSAASLANRAPSQPIEGSTQQPANRNDAASNMRKILGHKETV